MPVGEYEKAAWRGGLDVSYEARCLFLV